MIATGDRRNRGESPLHFQNTIGRIAQVKVIPGQYP